MKTLRLMEFTYSHKVTLIIIIKVRVQTQTA